MKSLNEHLGMILALVAFLFSYEFFVVTSTLSKQYKSNINNNYTIVITSSVILDKKPLLSRFKEIRSITPIATESIIKELREQISPSNLALLKVSLPKFYEVHLKALPTIKELKKIKQKLKRVDNILKVETFSKSYNSIYNLLIFFEYIAGIFLSIIIALSFLLIIKQSTLWQHKHSQMVVVLSYFGAPSFMRNGGLIKNAIIDTFIASVVTLFLVFIIFSSSYVTQLFTSLNIGMHIINYKVAFFEYLGICFIISTITISLAIYRIKDS